MRRLQDYAGDYRLALGDDAVTLMAFTGTQANRP